MNLPESVKIHYGEKSNSVKVTGVPDSNSKQNSSILVYPKIYQSVGSVVAIFLSSDSQSLALNQPRFIFFYYSPSWSLKICSFSSNSISFISFFLRKKVATNPLIANGK